MLKAQQMGMTPEAMIEMVSEEHQRDFAGFDISFDNYHSTHSDENRELASHIYLQLKRTALFQAAPFLSCSILKKRCSCRIVS